MGCKRIEVHAGPHQEISNTCNTPPIERVGGVTKLYGLGARTMQAHPHPLAKELVMDDLKMMKNPDSWPNWPQLPVKRNRNGHTAECGIMYENSRNVILTNMFASVEERQAANQISYDTYDAALADGWVVD